MVNLRDEFKSALLNGQLSLNYQPIVDLDSEKIRGFEALMRWKHPDLGPIPPGEFIPVAVESGLIVDASKWALKEACRALKRIEVKTFQQVKDMYVSVNFSTKDFAEDNFIEDLYQIIAACDVMPSQIQLEITEHLLMGQPETARKTLHLCRSAGLRIAVDDFGAGHGELDFIKDFPIDMLKLDRKLVRRLIVEDASHLAPTLRRLRSSHQLQICAEGVEEKEEAAFLKDFGCDFAQGYYFAKPLPEKEVIGLLQG